MDGKAHSIELADGRKATAWCDKVDCPALKLAYDTMSEIEVELKPWESKGKTGLNIVAIYIEVDKTALQTSDHHNPNAEGVLPTGRPMGKTSTNGQYQKSVSEKEMIKDGDNIIIKSPQPEDFGEADITSINAKSSVKIKKNSKGIGWEIKVVTGEIDLIHALGVAAIKTHQELGIVFPAETIHVA